MLTRNETSLLEADEQVESTFDLRWLFTQVVANWRWVVASVVLLSGAFTAYAFLWPPTYRASVVMAPAVTERGSDVVGLGGVASQLGGLASIAGLSLGPREAETEEALAVLQSREFTDKFIADRHLMPKFFFRKWDAARGAWKVDADDQPTPAKAFKYFNKKVRSIARDKKTGLVTLHIDWRDRGEGAEWANDLVRVLNQEMRTRAITKADAAMRFLETELPKTPTVEGRSAISRLMEAQQKQRMIANVTPDYSFRVIDPALPADRDDPVWPLRTALLIAGPLCGLAVGILVACYLRPAGRSRNSRG